MFRLRWIDLLAALALGALALLLFAVIRVNAAPAPLPRKAPPPRTVERLTAADLNGVWRLTWAGSAYEMYLEPGGGYGCWSLAPGARGEWRGRWWPDAWGRLVIEEEHHDGDGVPCGLVMTWTVDWEYSNHRLDPADLRGTTGHGGATVVRMRRPRKGE